MYINIGFTPVLPSVTHSSLKSVQVQLQIDLKNLEAVSLDKEINAGSTFFGDDDDDDADDEDMVSGGWCVGGWYVTLLTDMVSGEWCVSCVVCRVSWWRVLPY